MPPRMLLLASEAGLSRYFDTFLGHIYRESDVQLDVSVLISRLVSIMTEALKRARHTFALAEEYATLTINFLDHLVKPSESQANTISQAWISTFCSIAKTNDIAVNWTEDQSQFDILRSLLSIVQSFLEHGADVYLSNASSFSNGPSYVYPNHDSGMVNTVTSNIIRASDILLSWLNLLLGSLTHVPNEYAVLEQQMNALRLELAVRVADHPEKIKQQAWTKWLSSRTFEINAEYSARQQDGNVGGKARVIPDGPFEHHANITKPIMQTTKPVANSATEIGNNKTHRVKSIRQRSSLNTPDEPPSEDECASLPWSQWLASHYYRLCPRTSWTKSRGIKVVIGLPIRAPFRN